MKKNMAIAIEQNAMALQSLDELSPKAAAKLLRHLFTIENKKTHTYRPIDASIKSSDFTNKVRSLFNNDIQQLRSVSEGDFSIHRRLSVHLKSLSPDVPRAVREMLVKLKQADKRGELTTLSRTFALSLKQTYKRNAPADDILKLLDTANLFTWCAYSLYDHTLDTNDVSVLPYATSCLQAAIGFYREANVPGKLTEQLYQYVNQAGAIELHERRTIERSGQRLIIHKLPGLKRQKQLLADKSAVHCLGPLWISQIIRPGSPAYYAPTFQLYCAARQCNDDIHDWREDISEAQPTYVLARLLRAADITPGSYSIDTLVSTLATTYWDTQLNTMAKVIEKMADTASRQLQDIFVKDAPFNERFINSIKESAVKARQRHQFDKDFLAFYSSLDK